MIWDPLEGLRFEGLKILGFIGSFELWIGFVSLGGLEVFEFLWVFEVFRGFMRLLGLDFFELILIFGFLWGGCVLGNLRSLRSLRYFGDLRLSLLILGVSIKGTLAPFVLQDLIMDVFSLVLIIISIISFDG